jgi:hypothetical protein
MAERLKRPVTSLLRGETVVVASDVGAARWRIGREGRAARDPLFQQRHLLGGERIVRRHLEIRVRATHGLNQQRLAGFARHDRRAAVAAARKVELAIETEVTFLLFCAMTLVAVLSEQRPDFVLEEVGTITRLGGGKSPRPSREPYTGGCECGRHKVARAATNLFWKHHGESRLNARAASAAAR